MGNRRYRSLPTLMLGLILAGLSAGPAAASDHDDTALLKLMPQPGARLTDLYAFARADKLVLALCVDPTVPPGATEYVFAESVKFTFYIDNDSAVRFDDPGDLAVYGGTVVEPERIREDLTFTVAFPDGTRPRLRTRGLPPRARQDISLFTGLRDDPFIRGPRIGRNVAAIVLELPLAAVLRDAQPTLLVWATSRLADVRGRFHDHAGRALLSQFVENDLVNTRHPGRHHNELRMTPDVVVYDTSRPAAFPNGRELADDVVDLVGDLRVLANDDPFPTENDVPFLTVFPYLGPPHPPVAPAQ